MFGACSGFDRVEDCFWGADALYPCSGNRAFLRSADELAAFCPGPVPAHFQFRCPFPAKLGREANLLNCEMSYAGLKNAIETGEGLEGTIEFFPGGGEIPFRRTPEMPHLSESGGGETVWRDLPGM